MSTRRRRAEESLDSLELLLDTICNVFGGIILVTILVVLQTQVTAQSVRPSAVPDPRMQQAEFEVGRLGRELAELQAELEGLIASGPDLGEAVEVRGRKTEFLDAIETAQRQLERERVIAQETEYSLVQAEVELNTKEDELRRLGKDVEEARARVGTVPEAFRRDVRLPIWHDQAASIQRSILIDGDRAFALPEQCTEEVITPIAWRYRPVPGRGTLVKDEGTSRAAVASLLAGHGPRSTFVSFWVTDGTDSFETFQRLRSAVAELGYEYTVMAYEESEGLVLQPGRPRAE